MPLLCQQGKPTNRQTAGHGCYYKPSLQLGAYRRKKQNRANIILEGDVDRFFITVFAYKLVREKGSCIQSPIWFLANDRMIHFFGEREGAGKKSYWLKYFDISTINSNCS